VSDAPEAFDVIVVGFGYAGGIAAIEAHDAGASVLLLEKQPDPGGISVCSAGGLRIARSAEAALAYLGKTNGGTTPEPVLRRLAQGMTGLADYVRGLAASTGAVVGVRDHEANYPLPGHDTFGFVYIDDIPGFDPAREFPWVRGSPDGARLFKVVLEEVLRRSRITVRLAAPAERLLRGREGIEGVMVDGRTVGARRGIVLACGGFEGDAEMQRQFWQIKPVLSAAIRSNTGDGIRMAQEIGAGLWHMWHFHGSYGFRHPQPSYPFGIRLKRLPDWVPGKGLRDNVVMTWILVDRGGRRFMNEYEPYMQDTGHRPFETFDPAIQDYPRIPSFLIVDAAGRKRYPLAAPAWHDAAVAERYRGLTGAALDDVILAKADSMAELAAALDLDPAALGATISDWNASCAAGRDARFGRPPGSMLPLRTPPFYGAKVWPIVSNTQGGPVHDEEQRVLDAFGCPIPRLYAAGECGSVFGHLYMSGGNLAECFIGGRIAGRAAASGIAASSIAASMAAAVSR
jgi:succinate dehydrogenase/fumarate reductase flavoprotein subunit